LLTGFEADSGEWDVIVAADVIEHLSHQDGLELVQLIEAYSKVGIITTPIGHMVRGECEGNPYQKHLSAWYPPFFQMRPGWTVAVMNVKLNYFVAKWVGNA
jgi:hypothetical protein